MTSDAFPGYETAVQKAFRGQIDCAQLVQVYQRNGNPRREGYSPVDFVSTKQIVVRGKPDKTHISTSYIERQNLTVRMSLRRFTRLTNAVSKKLENLKAALYLHYAHYSFVRIHQTLRITPAMAAGITDHVWDIEEILNFSNLGHYPLKQGTRYERPLKRGP